jgi:hypothetical protein
MQGITIAHVRYMEGHSVLGDRTISVSLVAYATNLTIFQTGSNAPLLSIPWGNFQSTGYTVRYKRGVASVGSTIMSTLPILQLFNAASAFQTGFSLDFWEEEIQRNQSLFFGTGSEGQARRISQEIMRHRDNYQRQARAASRPERREPPADDGSTIF